MLEVKYNKYTKEVTGWCGDTKQFGYLKPDNNEKVVILDIPLPDKPPCAVLFSKNKLILNPDYVEPEPAINIPDKIKELEARVKKLEPL